MIDWLVLKIGPIHESLLGVGVMSTVIILLPWGHIVMLVTGKEAELREVKGVLKVTHWLVAVRDGS